MRIFTLIAYFRINNPRRALTRCGLLDQTDKIIKRCRGSSLWQDAKTGFVTELFTGIFNFVIQINLNKTKCQPLTIIEFDKVSVYQNENLILANVSLTICEGEFIYLIGKTGSGKSSLLQVIYGDIPVETGNARVAGYDLKTIRTKRSLIFAGNWASFSRISNCSWTGP